MHLHIIFMPSPKAQRYLTDGERAALNRRYEARYDIELAHIDSYDQARLAIQQHVCRFVSAERGELAEDTVRVAVAPRRPGEEARPYTFSYAPGAQLPLFGFMEYVQVLLHNPNIQTVLALVHVRAPCSEADRRRAAVVQAALLGRACALHSLARVPELLQLIVLDAVPYK